MLKESTTTLNEKDRLNYPENQDSSKVKILRDCWNEYIDSLRAGQFDGPNEVLSEYGYEWIYKAMERYKTNMLKKPHGGARKGAGRPKTKEETVVMRVPKSKVEAVKKLIKS